MSEFAHWLRRWRMAAAGLAAIAVFALLAGRFWHPYYGFTKFVQLDEADAKSGIREIREYPVFVYEGFNGYDGAAYTQIAFHPLLDSQELQPALGNVPYRARRILGSALAWLIARGEPAHIANTYAALNLAVWLALAILLWRLLPVTDARSWLAWAGVLFSAGVLHSVRLALTDLLATTLVAAAIALAERGRSAGALGALATAGLARETALGSVAALWRGPWTSSRAWLGNFGRVVVVVLPLLAWVIYVRWKAGPADQGFGNFTWPILGLIEKWGATFADYTRHPDFRWLNTATLLALIALSVQAAYFLRWWRPLDPWWRSGIAFVAMMGVLGTAVWEGHPGAATRVLLPMSVAFAVLAVRKNAHWTWLAAGSLTVFSGILALWHIPTDGHELTAGRFARGSYIVRVESGWFSVERHGRVAWAWCAARGQLLVETSPRRETPLRVRLKVRAIAPRDLEIRRGEVVLWRGEIRERAEWIELSATPGDKGRLALELVSGASPVRENDHPDARALGFAVYGVEVTATRANPEISSSR